MPEMNRKEWLLHLWEYHHGHLSKEDMKSVRERLAADVNARTDSEQVSAIINQLRQTGHWDPSPDFPARMVAPLLQNGRLTPARRILLASSATLLLVLAIWVAARGTHQTPLHGQQGQPGTKLEERRSPPASAPSTHPTPPGKGTPSGVRSRTSRFQLNDPVAEVESSTFKAGPVLTSTVDLKISAPPAALPLPSGGEVPK
jgi:hypothetical protein